MELFNQISNIVLHKIVISVSKLSELCEHLVMIIRVDYNRAIRADDHQLAA